MTIVQCPKCQLRFLTGASCSRTCAWITAGPPDWACRTGCAGRPTGAFR